MSKMFEVNGKRISTWNPIGGECPHKCTYCWAKRMTDKFNMKKYRGEIRLVKKELNKRFSPDTIYFVQAMSDLFAEQVPIEIIDSVLAVLKDNPKTEFLLLTKNPKRYVELIEDIPMNCTLGATIETNNQTNKYSEAPRPYLRWGSMEELTKFTEHNKMMVSIEPIMDFDLEDFTTLIKTMCPDFVYIGYDNYNSNLPEPSIEKTNLLINNLRKFTEVRLKTLR